MFKYLALAILMTGCCCTRQNLNEEVYENVQYIVEQHDAEYGPRCP